MTFTDNEEKEPSDKEYKAYDTVKKEWRHMNFFQHECCLHARVPRVKLDDGKEGTHHLKGFSGNRSNRDPQFDSCRTG